MTSPPAVPAAESRVVHYGIVPNPEAARVLVLPVEGGWSLPSVSTAAPADQAAAPVNQAFRGHLDLEVTVLRRVARSSPGKGERGDEVLLLENHGPLRPGVRSRSQLRGRWIGPADLRGLALAVPEHRVQIEQWFAEQTYGEVPPFRSPWARPGWFSEAAGWLLHALARQGMAASGPVEQHRTWSISCVLTVPTTGGRTYFKAVIPLFGHEPALTRALAQRFPGRVPEVVAIDQARGWLTTRRLRGTRLVDLQDASAWERAARLLAELHVACGEDTTWLSELGCVERAPDLLPDQVETLILGGGPPSGASPWIDAGERARFRALFPKLQRRCAEFAADVLPSTLVHGDLHANNIAVEGANIRFFDWTDGCVGHPFFDLYPLFQPGSLPAGQGVLERVRDAYLEPWTGHAPLRRLRQTFSRALPLAALHQAISYQEIATNVEDPEEWLPVVADYIRRAIDLLDTEH